MKLEELKSNWDELGDSDPYWAVLTEPSKINNKWEKNDFYATGRSWIDMIFNKFQLEQRLKHKDQALDFGCGPGRLTQALCQKFNRVVGIDISSSMIELANKNNAFPNSCNYFVNDEDDLSLLDSNQFDFILSFITLQHIKNNAVLNYIKEFSRISQVGGYVLFNLPSKPPFFLLALTKLIGLSGVNLIRKIYYRKKSVIEMHWIKEKTLLTHFQSVGLEVVEKVRDSGVGGNWESYMYLLKKSH